MHTMPNSAAVASEPRSQAGVAPQAEPSSDVAIEDWDILLDAVKARLKLTVGEEPGPQGQDEARRVRDSVLECVAALDQLHTTMTHELDRARSVRHRTDLFARLA
jgi:hypothetical protein